jgi:cell division protein FtsL
VERLVTRLTDNQIVVRRPTGPPPAALRLAALLVVPLLLYALVATGQKAVENYRLNQEADRLRAEIVSLRGENIQLQQDIEKARTDTAIETIAREQLGLIKPGDHPVILVGPQGGETAPRTASPTTAPAPQPPWRQWYDYFFG